jgi:hypothetical protein
MAKKLPKVSTPRPSKNIWYNLFFWYEAYVMILAPTISMAMTHHLVYVKKTFSN